MKVVVKVKNDTMRAPAPKTIYGEIDLSVAELVIGTPFVIGKKYFVNIRAVGDDFSNCGDTGSGSFIATNTTPLVWTASSVYIQNENVIIYQNNIDPNISVSRIGMSNLVSLKITNGGFVALKTMPNIIGGSEVNVINSNTIEFNNQNTVKYFKIEVLN